MDIQSPFVQRVLAHLPKQPVADFVFTHWDAGKPTREVLGLLPVPGVDAERFLARVMDIDHYTGKIHHVEVSRTVPDATNEAGKRLRFYQRIKIPLVGNIHHELVIERLGTLQGYEVAAWTLLPKETAALDGKSAVRSEHNDGAWLVGPGVVGYALSSVPRREDVGFIKWQALTRGADVAASTAVRDNIKGMAAWASSA